jgi:hypothetical protein
MPQQVLEENLQRVWKLCNAAVTDRVKTKDLILGVAD